MADAVFQHMVREAGLADQIEVDSAGTGDWHAGQQAHRGTLNVLRQKSIAYNGRARQILKTDLDEFDYVLGMDQSNVNNILALLHLLCRIVDIMFGLAFAKRPKQFGQAVLRPPDFFSGHRKEHKRGKYEKNTPDGHCMNNMFSPTEFCLESIILN